MRIETREDALREIMQILADYRQGKPVNFPQFLSDLETFLRNDKTVEELEAQIEELENQEPPITYSDIEAIEEPLIWAQHDLEGFRSFISSVKTELPDKLVEKIFSELGELEYDIDHALDKIHSLI